MIFLQDPIALGLLTLALIFIVFSLAREVRDARKAKLKEAHS